MSYAAVHFDTPPSVNAIWKPGRHDLFKSKEYRRWKRDASAEVMVARVGGLTFTGPIEVTVLARRHNPRADLDNIIKPLLDALQHGQLIVNDAQVERLHARWAMESDLTIMGTRAVRVEVRSC